MTSPSHLHVENGKLHGYFIYDVGDSIALDKLASTAGKKFAVAQLDLREMAAPGYIQFLEPPRVAHLSPAEVDGVPVDVRLKIFDYGVISLRLSAQFVGDFDALQKVANKLRHSKGLARLAEETLPQVLADLSPAINTPHPPLLEDYFVFELNSISPGSGAVEIMREFKQELAGLITGETRSLSLAEQEESLRVYFSYFEDDLAIVQWDSAVLIDTPPYAEATLGILEFANTQLVELRTYDARLDAKLDEIYKSDVVRTSPHFLFGRKDALKRIDRLRSLVIDVRELTDRSSNALKIIGDAFYARLYRGAASRLGLEDWHHQMESKLKCIDDVYQFAVDQAQHNRSEFLELIIIALITFEIFLSLYRGH